MTAQQAAALVRSWLVVVIDLLLLVMLLAALAKAGGFRIPIPSPSATELAYLAGARWLATR